MKKIYKSLLALSFAALISVGASAQKDMFENGFTLKFHVIPSSTSLGDVSELNQVSFTDYQTQAVTNPTVSLVPPIQQVNNKSNMGFGLELGTMFFLNSIDFSDIFRLGIDVTWFEFDYSGLTYDTEWRDFSGALAKDNDGNVIQTSSMKGNSLRMGAKVGVSASVNPADNLAIDLSLRANPMFHAMLVQPTQVYNGTDANGTWTMTSGAAQGGFGIRFVPGLYLRYNVLLIGAEMAMGSITHTGGSATNILYEPNNSAVPGLGVKLDGSYGDIHEYKSQVNEFKILLGFKF